MRGLTSVLVLIAVIVALVAMTNTVSAQVPGAASPGDVLVEVMAPADEAGTMIGAKVFRVKAEAALRANPCYQKLARVGVVSEDIVLQLGNIDKDGREMYFARYIYVGFVPC